MKRIKRWLAGLLSVVMLLCLLPTAALAAEGDVPWAVQAVDTLNRIYGSGVFEATNGDMTEADAASILEGMGCVSTQLDASSSTKLSRGTACKALAEVFQLSWDEGKYSSAIEYFHAQNIVNGYADGDLGVDDAVSQAQFAVLAFRILNSVGGGQGSSITLKPGTKEYFSWMYLAARDCVPFKSDQVSTKMGAITEIQLNQDDTVTSGGAVWGKWIGILNGLLSDGTGKFTEDALEGLYSDEDTMAEAAVKIVDAYIKASGSPYIFEDIPPEHWAYDGVMYLFDQGIISGQGDGTFGGANELPRYQLAVLLGVIDGADCASATGLSRLTESVAYAIGQGYLSGTAGTDPDWNPAADSAWSVPATREEAIVAFTKCCIENGAKIDLKTVNTAILECFTDGENISDDAAPYVAYAVSLGLVRGKYDQGTETAYLDLEADLIRSEAGILLYRTLIGVDSTKMKDYAENVGYATGTEPEVSYSASTSMLSAQNVRYGLSSVDAFADDTPADNTLTLKEDWRLTADMDLAVPQGTTLTISGGYIYEMGGRLLNSGLGTVTFSDSILYPAANDADLEKVQVTESWDATRSGQLMLVRQPHAVAISDDIENGTVSSSVTQATLDDTVTLTVTPADDYELDDLTVTAAEGDDSGSVVVDLNNYTFTMPASDVTVTATFKVKTAETYTVSFDANGGTLDATGSTTGTDGKLTSLPTPAREGYTFNGWFTASVDGTQVTIDTVFTEDTTIYAQWTEESTEEPALVSIEVTTQPSKTTYTVGETFSSEGMVITATYSDNSTQVVTNYTVSPEGALTADDAAITITYTEGDVEKTATLTITVNPADADTYTVTVTNGTGSGDYVEGATVTITANAPEAGKQFREWTGADSLDFTSGGKTSATASFTMPAEEVNVEAAYEDISEPEPAAAYNITIIGPIDTLENVPAIALADDGTVAAIQGSADTLYNPKSNTDSDVQSKLTYWVYNGWTFTAVSLDGQAETYGPTKVIDDGLKSFLNEKINNNWTLTMDSRTPGYYSYPSSGSSSSGSSSSTTTTTTKNPDGSTTTTTTNKTTGTVTETIKYPDGSTTTVVTEKNGAATETVKTAGGVTGTTVTDKRGDVTEIAASVPSTAAREARENGETVTLPVEAPAATGTDDAPAVKITVPKSAGDVRVEIPVENAASGTVAVIVHADGSEEIVKTSVPTEDGVALTVSGTVTVKVVDNSKYFTDVHPVDHWAEDAVDFVSSRELFTGTTATTFSPSASTTRGQLMTVLARLDGADTSEAPIQQGMAWAMEHGVSDGSDPGRAITRQELAVMLWRYAGCPGSSHPLSYADAAHISAYAETAMRWAVENGILQGYTDGTVRPQNPATRAHVATMIMRYTVLLGA